MTAMAHSTVIRWAGATDVGRVRSDNQDSYLTRSGLWVVADGMGGHRGGEIASSLAVEALARHFGDPTVDGLVGAIDAANAAIHDAGNNDPELIGMGTTVVAIAEVEQNGHQVLAVANVGDSRAYRMTSGELEQLTEDHSLVADMVREGSLSAEEAATHPDRSRCSALRPSCASARGRDASITTSAAAISRARAAAPSAVWKSRATPRCPPWSRSKSSGGPRRAPSGRWTDSTFTTCAPSSPRIRAHNGPAHSDDRSTTSGADPALPVARAGRLAGVRSNCVGRTGNRRSRAGGVPGSFWRCSAQDVELSRAR